MGNLTTPPSVQKLQSALHAKAKEEPGYRFYLLYDKVSRADVLEYAYRCCKANKGAAGVDGQRFEDIEAYGEDRWLGELTNRLRTKTYEPRAVKRVWIPKPNSKKMRPLVDGDTPRVRSCCLTKECYSWARCRFGFFSSIFMVEGGGHVVEGCGGGQRSRAAARCPWVATGAPQAHRPHAHGLPGAKRPSPSAALKFRVWVTLRLVLAQTCVGCP